MPSEEASALHSAVLPNIITCSRIALAVPLFFLCMQPDLRWAAVGVFIVGMATDGLDGFLARKLHAITKFGALIDPIADKILVASALLPLCILGEVSWWVFALIFLREFAVTVFRLVIAGRKVISANIWGKAKTVLQTLTISFALLPVFVMSNGGVVATYVSPMFLLWLTSVKTILLLATVAVTLYTGIVYCLEAIGPGAIRKTGVGGPA